MFYFRKYDLCNCDEYLIFHHMETEYNYVQTCATHLDGKQHCQNHTYYFYTH